MIWPCSFQQDILVAFEEILQFGFVKKKKSDFCFSETIPCSREKLSVPYHARLLAMEYGKMIF